MSGEISISRPIPFESVGMQPKRNRSSNSDNVDADANNANFDANKITYHQNDLYASKGLGHKGHFGAKFVDF